MWYDCIVEAEIGIEYHISGNSVGSIEAFIAADGIIGSCLEEGWKAGGRLVYHVWNWSWRCSQVSRRDC